MANIDYKFDLKWGDEAESKSIFNGIIHSIPDYCDGDQLKTFTYIYVALSKKLCYDEEASELASRHLAGHEREMANDFVIDPANNISCLARGKALCGGYARTLAALLETVGIEAEVVRMAGVHAWNQVKINGEWYNCDLTNDSDFIAEGLACPHFLKSNSDDCNYTKRYPTTDFAECDKSIPEDVQESLIKEALHYIEQREVEQNDEYSIFEFYLPPVNEFYYDILHRGESVEILSPEPVRKKFMEIVNNLTKVYTKKK